MKNDLRLTIIIPVYNVESYLQECIDSLFNQDIPHEDYEIILINDGSTDSSYEIAKANMSLHGNLHLLTQTNQGQSVARNRGLDIARGNFIMFVDSDDRLFPNVVGKILKIAESNRLDVCAYRISFCDEEGNAHQGSIQPFETNRIYDGRYAVTHGADIGGLWLNLYSKRMIENSHLRFVEGIYHQDVDFNLRMYALADRMMFTDIVAYNYRYVPGSSTRKPNKDRIAKLINDDFFLVRHIRDFSEEDNRGRILHDFYVKHGNSLIVSCLLQLLRDNKLEISDKVHLINKAKELKLYPIKGHTLSWKSNLLKCIFNFEGLYFWLIKRLCR